MKRNKLTLALIFLVILLTGYVIYGIYASEPAYYICSLDSGLSFWGKTYNNKIVYYKLNANFYDSYNGELKRIGTLDKDFVVKFNNQSYKVKDLKPWLFRQSGFKEEVDGEKSDFVLEHQSHEKLSVKFRDNTCIELNYSATFQGKNELVKYFKYKNKKLKLPIERNSLKKIFPNLSSDEKIYRMP